MSKERITSSRTESERFEQKRRYPRIILDDNAILLLPGNQPVNVQVFDLSICAIQLRFNAQTEQTISTALQYVDDDALASLDVRFRIKLHGKEEVVRVPCKPIYICQLARDVFSMGMQFSDMESRYKKLISKFVEASLEPK